MSLQALQWAFDQPVFSSTQKFVLVALANFANETGKAYPSVATICEITCQNDKTVRKALASLAGAGLIEDTGMKFGSTQQVKVWQLPPPAWERSPKMGIFKATQKRGSSRRKGTPEDPPKVPTKIPNLGERSLEPVTLEPSVPSVPRAIAPRPSGPKPAHLLEDIPEEKNGKAIASLIACWCRQYEGFFGHKYSVQPKDGKAIKILLASTRLGPDALVDIARRAWEKAGQFPFDSSLSIFGFNNRFNEINSKLTLNGHRRPEAREADERIEVPSE